jgi:hypothetical protein
MIHIFGDSHGDFNFRNIKYGNVKKHYRYSTTMHRVGRDKTKFIDFKYYDIHENDIVIYQFGEVDCRCHIGKQLLLGNHIDTIINELIHNYFESIKINIQNMKNIQDTKNIQDSYIPFISTRISNKNRSNKLNIIVCCVPPTMNQSYHENIHGKITHEFPFVNSDEERINYTKKMNQKIKEYCQLNNFHFLDYYDNYLNTEGTLNVELSDDICHIKKNEYILEELYKIIDK